MDKINLSDLKIVNYRNIYRNLPPAKLLEISIERKEGIFTNTGAFVVNTGKYNGRSPDDRFIVDTPSVHDDIAWGKVNKPISEEVYENLYQKMRAYIQGKDLFVFDGFVGADRRYGYSLRVVCELANQALASSSLFLRPSDDELKNFKPDINVICLPNFKAIPELDKTNSECFIIINYDKMTVLIGGTQYFGEIKKSIFTMMNYLLPKKNVFPMHCSANTDDKENSAIFFGLSGTGKTTLSADIERRLIGDDEHGWSEDGVFNFEGGCYAKTINLKRETEPQIYDSLKFGAVLENVIVKDNGEPDYADGSLTENTRAAYPIHFIPNADLSGKCSHPKYIIFLTADAFGVLPPVSLLSVEEAMFHFVSGYTSKLAGTERGIVEPQATFSTCFGAPFMPLSPDKYAKMLKEKILKHKTKVYLLNTGWTGGPYGVGKRFNLPYTRRMVKAILTDEFGKIKFEKEEFFGLMIPTECPDVPKEVLNPINTWANKEEYKKTALNLKARFEENFKKMNISLN
ncbi:MAG: phosphoenolpyruvate carboxykinase (ATP) [candidate division WOR-3 bacterium]